MISEFLKIMLIRFRFHSQFENLLRVSVTVLHVLMAFDLVTTAPCIYVLSLSEHPVRNRARIH